MLGPDQQRVVERPRPKPRRETHRALPILTSHEAINRAGQALLQTVELRLTRYSCFLPLVRHRVRLSQKPVCARPLFEQGLRLPGTPGTHERRDGSQSTGRPPGTTLNPTVLTVLPVKIQPRAAASEKTSRRTPEMSRSRSLLGAVQLAVFARRHAHTLMECRIGTAPTRPPNPATGGIDRQVSFTQ